ncbi:putative HNHc nuclease [Leuconostocaceae bacterium ESL0958]|nr:putative HNHc nuclease [Leuconostocaceae bacterium ESL0958]
MEIAGKLLNRRGAVVTIELDDLEKLNELEKFGSSVVSLIFCDSRSVTVKQRNFAFAIMNDIAKADIGGQWAGNEDATYEHFKFLYRCLFDDEQLSLSARSGNRESANRFIDLLLRFCLANNVSLSRKPLSELDSDFVEAFEYSCLISKKCVICGLRADLHHLTGSKVGMGNNRNHINHLGRRVMALCRKHHDQFHHEEEQFMADNHLSGVLVDEKIARIYKLHTG